MNNVTLRQLRYFDALARHGHFGRAAEACAISQPALSMQIKELEESLGGLLMERSARQVALTDFGGEFAARVRDILRAVEELGDFARASRDRLAGRLRVGMIPTIAPYLLPKVIANLARMHPELDVHVRETVTPKLIDELVEGRLDAAILALPVSEPTLSEAALFTENFLLVRPGEDEGTPVPSAETLREMRLLLLEEGHCFRDQALSFCNMQASPPREVLDASSLSTLVQMVSAGIGVTLIPEMAVAVETRSASVSVARFEEPQPARTIGMVWRRTSPLARQLAQISEVVRLSADAMRAEHAAGPVGTTLHRRPRESGGPVSQSAGDGAAASRRTGSPAFAGDDGRVCRGALHVRGTAIAPQKPSWPGSAIRLFDGSPGLRVTRPSMPRAPNEKMDPRVEPAGDDCE